MQLVIVASMYNIEKIDYTTFVSATMDLRREGFYKEERPKASSPAPKACGSSSPPSKKFTPMS